MVAKKIEKSQEARGLNPLYPLCYNSCRVKISYVTIGGSVYKGMGLINMTEGFI